MERTPHVADGVLHHGSVGSPDLAVGSAAWFSWLDDPSNRSFSFAGSAGSLTARKERRGGGGDGYWTAYRKRDGKLLKTYLGKAAKVTQHRLDEAARSLAGSGTDRSPDERPVGGSRPIELPAPTRGDPLLLTKFAVPAPRLTLVRRAALSARIDEAWDRRLTVLSAPAGFGKSTLLATWVAATTRENGRVAWLSLDARDDDPSRFWRYFVTALSRLEPGCGDTALALLGSPQAPPVTTVLTTVLNDLESVAGDVAFVLDDYHVLEASGIHEAMTFILENLPPRVHLIIATRADPPLPMSRLRTRGQLLELRAHDLRFGSADAGSYFSRMGLELSEHQVSELVTRTEGWVGGLQLAALALRDHPNITTFIDAFSGSNRYVVDYLAEEVLSRRTEAERAFLLKTSILDRMCGPLCEAVTGDGDSQEILERLEHANLFMNPLDDVRGWYRYHQLFADVLNQRLQHEHPGLVADLHKTASAWFAGRGVMLEAIPHALAGHDLDRAVDLIESAGMAVVLNHEIQTLLGWMDDLPEPLVNERPMLLAVRGLAFVLSNRPDAATASLRDAELRLGPDPRDAEARGALGRVSVTRAAIARFTGDIEQAASLSRRVLQLLPEGDAFAIERASARVNVGLSYQVTGRVNAVDERPLEEGITAFAEAKALMPVLNCINRLGRFQTMQGRLRAAAVTYQRGIMAASGKWGRRGAIETAGYHVGMGLIDLQHNDLDPAERHLSRAVALITGAITVEADQVTDGYIQLARLQQARGQPARAQATLAEFADVARQRAFFPLLAERGEAEQARLALQGLDLSAAFTWADGWRSGADVTDYRSESQLLTLTRVRLAQARLSPRSSWADDAATLLDRLLEGAEAGGRWASVIEILALSALAKHLRRDPDAAAALERAIRLASPENFIRVFLDEGEPMAALLVELLTSLRTARAPHDLALLTYVRRLLAAFETPGNWSPDGDRPLVDPLTAREIEVLQLIAAGLSNREIAARLYVATSTVKSYTNSIYRRLGVGSRTEAIAEARARQLLAD